MPKIAIIVEFETLDGQEDAFLTLIREHAAKTLVEEPGCLRFEVIKSVEREMLVETVGRMVRDGYAVEGRKVRIGR